MLAEHQRKLQEEERRRREEEERKERERKERERKEREERERIERTEKERVEREERERREREERERQAKEKKEREERERKQKEEAERKEKEEKERKACEQKEKGETLGKEEERRRVEEVAGPGKGKRDSIEILDSEISDVLFQFDKIVGALEKETDSSRATPTDFLPLSQVTMQAGQSVENIQPESDQSNQSTEFRAGQSHEVINDLEGPMETTSKDEVEEDVSQAKNRPTPLDTALSSKPPTEKSSSEEEQLLSPKISVKELQQQFLLSSVPARHTSISPEAERPASSVNVRTLIAQMQTTKPPPSPPPSPVSKYESTNVIRRRPPSPTVYRRISELTHGLEDEKRQSKTYEPPPVRRRIQSPFLQPKKEKEGNLPVKSAGTKESTTSVKQNHVFNHMTSQSDRVPAQAEHMNAQDDHMIPLEDHMTDKNRVTPVEGHVTPVEDHVTQVEDHVTPVEDRVTPVPVDHVSPVDHVTSVEDHVTPVEDHVTPVDDHVTPVEDHVTPVEDHVTSKDSVVIKEDDLTTKENDVTPDLTPKVDSVTPAGNRMVPTESQVTSNEAIDKKTSKSELSPAQITNASLPELANVSLQPPRETSPLNETSEVVTPEGEFIPAEVFSEQSSPPATNEGPLPLSPPILVSPPAHVVETTPPLVDEPKKKERSVADLKPPETKDVHRQRSANESAKSTRVYAMGIPYRSAAVRSKERLQNQLSADDEEYSTGDSVVRIEHVRGAYTSLHVKLREKIERLSIIDF